MLRYKNISMIYTVWETAPKLTLGDLLTVED